ANKFADVELRCSYSAPSGKKTDFIGFYDGDGKGGGDLDTGSVWKTRFFVDELGAWHYQCAFSDGTAGAQGDFTAVSAGAGKGILRAYQQNPRWFAYNGTNPVWLKSYYESSHRGFAQPLDWMVKNVYQPLVDSGYNHFQVDALLPLC